jgi:hypothetical protein
MKRYLTNMDNYLKPIVEEAIQLSGRTDIHIDDDPMPPHQKFQDRLDSFYNQARPHLISKLFSIYISGEGRDASDFWATYRQVMESERWQVYLSLVKE